MSRPSDARRHEKLSSKPCGITGEMTNARRAFVATFSLWLLATWALPLCCLSMSDRPAGRDTADAAMAAMPVHHHHHQSAPAEPDRSKFHLSANDSCKQSCQPTASPALTSVPRKADAGHLKQTTLMVTASLQAIAGSSVPLRDTSPPGLALAPPLQPAPLRI
jgi:hypothetical protein